MPEMPAELKPRLQSWWSTLDDGTHTIFEAIYLEAPAAVSRAISGGQWVADAPEPGLAAQLGGAPDAWGGDAHAQVPQVTPTSEIRMSPNAAVGTAVPMAWTEENMSAVEMPAYFTDVYVENAEGEVVGSARLTNPALAPGASAERSYQFPGGQTEGTHVVKVYINAEGSDPGQGVPGAQGYRTVTGGTFVVGQHEEQADQQNDQIVMVAVQALVRAGSEWPPSAALEQVTEAVNWLSGHDQLDEQSAQTLAQVSQWLVDPPVRDADDRDEENPEFRTALATLSGSANAAQTMHPTEQALAHVVDALRVFTSRSY